MRQRPWLRNTAIALAFPAVIAVSVGVIGLAGATDFDETTAAIFLVPVVVYGALVGRRWILVLPLAWSTLWLGVLRIADLITGGCSVCGSDESWENYPILFFFLAVVPLTVVLLIGVLAGVAIRAFRRRKRRRAGVA